MEKSAAVGVWDKLVRRMLFRWFHHQMTAILSLESGFNVLIYFCTQSKVFSPIVEPCKPAQASTLALIWLPVLVISQIEHQVAQPFLEFRIVCVLLEQFHVVCHD